MLALPIALGVGGLQLLHEVGHLLAALRSNVKIGFPVAVPSLQAHRLSHSRSHQQSRKAAHFRSRHRRNK